MAFKIPNQYRITEEIAGKIQKIDKTIDNRLLAMWINQQHEDAGFFMLPNPKNMKGIYILCMASGGSGEGLGWDHVSVSIPTENRCPTWEEMCFVKSLFWDGEDTVIQFHPPESEYVNNHKFCLHLWKPVGEQIKTPPSIMVGTKQK